MSNRVPRQVGNGRLADGHAGEGADCSGATPINQSSVSLARRSLAKFKIHLVLRVCLHMYRGVWSLINKMLLNYDMFRWEYEVAGSHTPKITDDHGCVR